MNKTKAFFLIHPSSLIPHPLMYPFLLDVLSARLLGSNSGLFAEGQANIEVSRPALFAPPFAKHRSPRQPVAR